MQKDKLIDYINNYLKIKEFEDVSNNGLQVDSSKDKINKLAISVDASSYNIDQAIKENVDAILVHHGLLWGQEKTITGIYHKNISKLIKSDIALLAYHLPLDAHEKVGNNKGLIDGIINICAIDNYKLKRFADYKDQQIGYGINFENKLSVSSIVNKFLSQLKLKKTFYNYGKLEYINSIGICTGGGGKFIQEAYDQNYDILLTGEIDHGDQILAKQLGQSVILAGHWETEKIGVKLLANHLKNEFGIDSIFVDQGVGQY